MALTPIDVQQKTFKIALRGYAEDEVDEFLDAVVISLREYEQQLRDTDERVSLLEDQLKANRETEDAIRRTFVAAQRTADTIVDEARQEADRLLAEASSRANLLTDEQLSERERLVSELVEMREKTSRLRSALGSIVADVEPRLTPLDTELQATSYEPLEVDEAPPHAPEPPDEGPADAPSDVDDTDEDLAEQDAMFQPSEDTGEMTVEIPSADGEPDIPQPDEAHDEPDESHAATVSTWVPVEEAEEREGFEWGQNRDRGRRPWERG